MRRILCGLLAVAAMGCTAATAAAPPISLKFSHVVAPDAPKGKGADKFKQLAEQYTNGRVKVDVFTNSTLYKDQEELEALQVGAVQMIAPSLAKLGPLGARDFEVFDLPFLIPTEQAAHAVFDGPIGKRMLRSLDDKGITGIAFWDGGKHIFTANRPLRSVEDFKGLKLRIQGSKVLEAQARILGALPQIMASAEVYQALQTGVVDGSESDRAVAYTQRYYEVQKYITLSDHGLLEYAVMVNKPFWDGLPPDIRQQLERAMAEATAYERDVTRALDVESEAAMAASGKTTMITLSDQERLAFRRALRPVYDFAAPRLSKGLIAAVQAAVSAAVGP